MKSRHHRFYIAALIAVVYGLLYVFLAHVTIDMGHRVQQPEEQASFQMVNLPPPAPPPVAPPPPPPPPIPVAQPTSGGGSQSASALPVITTPSVMPHFDVPLPDVNHLPMPKALTSLATQGTGDTGTSGTGAGTGTGDGNGDAPAADTGDPGNVFDKMHFRSSDKVVLILDTANDMRGIHTSPEKIEAAFGNKFPLQPAFDCNQWVGFLPSGFTSDGNNDIYTIAYYRAVAEQPTAIVMAAAWKQYQKWQDRDGKTGDNLGASDNAGHDTKAEHPYATYQFATRKLLNAFRKNGIRLYIVTYGGPPFPELVDYVKESGGEIIDASPKATASTVPSTTPNP